MRNLFGEVATRPNPKRKTGKRGGHPPGCEYCPLNTIPGVRKVKGLSRIEGRRAMLWAQSPGRNENLKEIELIGRAGDFLWSSLRRVGLKRENFDIQNVVRCWPIDSSGQEHPPTKDELFCCSIYNQEAIDRNAGAAKVHLVLGKAAGLQLLGRHYRKDQAVTWYEPWDAYVVVADHPSYLLRIGGENGGWQYFTFLDRLRALKELYHSPGRWGYVKSRPYTGLVGLKEIGEFRDFLMSEAEAGRKVSLDIEDGTIDGVKRITVIGFGYGEFDGKGKWEGGAKTIVVDHREVKRSEGDRRKVLEILRGLLEDPKVSKVMQHGSYDVNTIRELWGIRVKGYCFDTQYATYLKYPQLRTYSLDRLGNMFFPEFADYKQMMEPYSGNYANAPLSTLVPYNCADADLTKRLSEKVGKFKVSLPLLQVYIDVAFVLEAMEDRGPYLDEKNHAHLSKLIPEHVASLRRRLCQIAGRDGFNPNTPAHIAWLIYDKLKLPPPEGSRSTTKEVLATLAIQHPECKVPQMVLDYRSLAKIESTYLVGYKKSADLHDWELRTIWWLTGAITGRLRSGKGDAAEVEGVLNFQNFHGNPILQNMLVSDLNWRRVLDLPLGDK